jgi:hypothetical protein
VGLQQISVTEVIAKLNVGSTDVYWKFMNEVAAPVVAALSKADEEMKVKIKREVFELVDQKYPRGNISIDSGALVIYGVK